MVSEQFKRREKSTKLRDEYRHASEQLAKVKSGNLYSLMKQVPFCLWWLMRNQGIER